MNAKKRPSVDNESSPRASARPDLSLSVDSSTTRRRFVLMSGGGGLNASPKNFEGILSPVNAAVLEESLKSNNAAKEPPKKRQRTNWTKDVSIFVCVDDDKSVLGAILT